MEFPDDLRYTKDHEWLRLEKNEGVVGITDFAQDALGDVVFVELPTVGATLTQGQTFGVVESNKTVSDLFAPVSGRVVAVNQALRDQPELVNTDPYGAGWMIRLVPARPEDVDGLLDAAAYHALIASEQGAVSGYSPHTAADVAAMLATIGVTSIDDLFSSIPATLRQRARLELPEGLSEPELRRQLEELAGRSAGSGAAVFLGAGSYPHWVPTLVDQMLLRSEFATAYTPYQPEVSQGTLQAVFEFQTFVALLLGLDVANASMYDGASALAEAVLMAHRLLPDRRTVWMARSIHPDYRATVATYLRGLGHIAVREIPFAPDGRMDLDVLQAGIDEDTLCVVAGYPNVFGVIDDLPGAAAAAHQAGALAISVTTEPLALALVRSPGGAGADIAVAEGQSFGLPMSYGGPGVGLFATHERFVRSMPGRIVGETVDGQGRRGFVLTLATREQHIRRERATSNICTNQGLCALAVTVYLSLVGRNGLRQLAETNYACAHVTAGRLESVGRGRPFTAPFFNEFVVEAPEAVARWDRLAAEGLVAGFPLGRWYPELKDALLVCVTETHTAPQIDRLVAALAAPARSIQKARA